MGIGSSTDNDSLPVHFSTFKNWTWKQVLETMTSFAQSDLKYGVDITGVAYLTKYDFKMAKRLMSSLSQNDTGIINTTVLMATIILLADSQNPYEEERLNAAFTVFDLNETQRITIQELAILLYTFDYATSCILGKAKAQQSIQFATKKASHIYSSIDKDPKTYISREEFVTWSIQELQSVPMADLKSLQSIIKTYDDPNVLQIIPPATADLKRPSTSTTTTATTATTPEMNQDRPNTTSVPLTSKDSAFIGDFVAVTSIPITNEINSTANAIVNVNGYGNGTTNDYEYEPFEKDPGDAGIPVITSKHGSVMAATLRGDDSLYSQLAGIETPTGYTIDKLIQAGLDVPDLCVGCVFGDETCYEHFKILFDPVISCLHNFFPDNIHKTDLNPEHVQYVDLNPDYVRSCNIRAHRNIVGFNLPPFVTRAERRKIEQILTNVMSTLSGECSGKYYPLDSTDPAMEKRLLFGKPATESSKPDAFDCGRDWPDARGIYYNGEKHFVVWLNDEDHMKIISMQKGADVQAVFTRWCNLARGFETALNERGYKFMHSEHLGYLSTCPSKLGTGLRLGMSVKLPHLSKYEKVFAPICFRLGLSYMLPSSAAGWCDISNTARIGPSETELVQTVINGVQTLIELEKALERNDKECYQTIFRTLPDIYTYHEIQSDYIANEHYRDTDTDISNNKYALAHDDFPLFTSEHMSLMSKYLTPEIYEQCIQRKSTSTSSSCFGFRDAIFCGVEHPLHGVGIVAGDKDSYNLYKVIFDPIISELHYDVNLTELACNKLPVGVTSRDIDLTIGLDPYSRIISCRVDIVRNIDSMPFLPAVKRGQRRDIEKVITNALSDLTGPLFGEYHKLSNLTDDDNQSLLNELDKYDLLPNYPDNGVSGYSRDWPDARGLYHNENKDLIVWVNHEEHMRVIAFDNKGSNVIATFLRALDTVNTIEQCLVKEGYQYMFSDRLGYLSSCPSNLGTGLEVRMIIALNAISIDNIELVEDICNPLHLGIYKVNLPASISTSTNLWEISQKATLDTTEISTFKNVLQGIAILTEIDKKVAGGESIDNVMKALQTIRRSSQGMQSDVIE
eukprot:gene10871-22703_t